RAYIVDLTTTEQFGRFATRHAYHYADVCTEVERLYRCGGESVYDAINLFDNESVNIAAGFHFTAAHASTEASAAQICTSFVRGLTHVMDLRLSPLARAEVLVAGLQAAKTLQITGLVVLHTGNLGRVYRELGDLEMSLKCQEQVLQMATREG